MDPRVLSPVWRDETRWNPMVEAGSLHGPLHVHVFGGGTWCSEFTSLVGLPTPALGVMGGYATYILQDRVRESLVSHLHAIGYRTESLYPGPGDFVNGGNFHKGLGFDAFLDFGDRKGFKRSYWSLTDREVYETALERIEKQIRENPEQPLYLWVKTIRNHGPHGMSCEGRDFSSVDPLLMRAGFDPAQNCSLRDYLERYEHAVEAYSWFRSELARRFPQRRFSILQFGDHQPTLTETLRSRSGAEVLSLQARHLTYFAMDHVGDRTGGVVPVPPRVETLIRQNVDLAYISALWLEALGLPLSSMQDEQLRTALVCQGSYPQEASSPGGTPQCLDALSRYHGRMVKSGAIGI